MTSSRWSVSLITGVISLQVLVSGIGFAHADRADHLAGMPPSSRACGLNSIYMYLRLHGRDVSFAALADRMVISADGTTMADLSAVARENGLTSHVLKLTPRQLGSASFPCIAHYNWRSPSNQAGHYVVVTRVSADAIEYIDGTTGKPTIVRRKTFEYFWSGHVVAPEVHSPVSFSVVLLLGIDVVIFLVWIRRRFR